MASSPPKPVLIEEPGAHSGRHLDGSRLSIAIISTRWYGKDIVDPLVKACKDELLHKGVSSDRITMLQVPGAFELPFAASRVIHAKKKHLDAVVCIGCMVKGATMAYEFVSEATTMALMKLNVKTETPVVNGLLTCHSEHDAKQCAASLGACLVGPAASESGSPTTKQCSHGVAWAQEALELALLKRATADLIAKKCQCVCHCKQQGCKCACHCGDCKCHACSCEGECKCSACFSHHEEKTELKEMVQAFEQALGGCCGTTTKRQATSTERACGGCDKPGCECGGARGAQKTAKCSGCDKPDCGCGGKTDRASQYICGGCGKPGCGCGAQLQKQAVA